MNDIYQSISVSSDHDDLTMSRAHNFLLSLPAEIEFRRLKWRKVKES